jgi:hypothetical protein
VEEALAGAGAELERKEGELGVLVSWMVMI